MSNFHAFKGARIFDGLDMRVDCALLVEDDFIVEIVPHDAIPKRYEIISLEGGLLAPGFIDLQVNGGGGVLLNDDPSVSTIRTICDAHEVFGTTALLPTLITDNLDVTKRAIEAGISTAKKNVRGFLGLHLEGPHLSVIKKGAHDASHIRKMTDEDLELLLYTKYNLPNLMVTLALESVTFTQIDTLSKAGVIVSLGHTNCSFDDAVRAFEAGATCVTHLFNAMSPLTHREPGLVGAALSQGGISCGLIADGHHVKPTAISIAHKAKRASGNIFLVTDAMSTIGTDLKSFKLKDREIFRNDGVLTLKDGTLAGADLDMMSAVNNIQTMIGLKEDEALKMASLYPAQCMGIDGQYGSLKPSRKANFVHISDTREVDSVWISGQRTN